MSDCTFNQGRGASLGLGIESTWGTAVDAKVRLPIDSESLSYEENQGTSDALMGTVYPERMDILSEHTEGDFSTYLTPDEIGILLYLTLGTEYEPVELDTGKYKHLFAPVRPGGSRCLPHFTIELDRVYDTMQYISSKVNSLSLSASREDYVTASFDTVGYDEDEDVELTPDITVSSKDFFKFRKATVVGDKLDTDYEVDGETQMGVEDDTASIPASYTGAEGHEIQIFARDSRGYAFVFEYIGDAVSRDTDTLTFKDSPAVDDEIASIHDSNGVLDTENWEVVTEELLDITEITADIENSLQTDRYTTGYSGKLGEINPTDRSLSLSISTYLNDEIKKWRKERFKAGRYLSLSFEFESFEKFGDENYIFGLVYDRCYVTNVDDNVDSPDEVEGSLDLTPTEISHPDYTVLDTESDMGTGIATDTITVTDSVFHTGTYVRAIDPEGYKRIYKYLGEAVTVEDDTVTMTDSADVSASEIEPIWEGESEDEFNDDYWQLAEGVYAYVIDDRDSRWAEINS
jgi:hypothetical protein